MVVISSLFLNHFLHIPHHYKTSHFQTHGFFRIARDGNSGGYGNANKPSPPTATPLSPSQNFPLSPYTSLLPTVPLLDRSIVRNEPRRGVSPLGAFDV